VLVDKLESALNACGSPLPKLLEKGLSLNEIEFHINKVNLKLPNEVVELYSWRNGTKGETNNEQLFTLGEFFSLQEAIETYKYFVENNYWKKSLFPLFGAGNSEFFLIDCEATSNQYKMILFFSLTNYVAQQPLSYFDSLFTLISTVTDCYNSKAYSFDNGNFFVVKDPSKELEICKKHNPRSDYWKIIDH
jgi:hypothetical protein